MNDLKTKKKKMKKKKNENQKRQSSRKLFLEKESFVIYFIF